MCLSGRSLEYAKHFDISTASPLHFASMLALSKCCEWLLQKGCHANQSSVFGTPLECALLGDAVLCDRDFGLELARLRSEEVKVSRSAVLRVLLDNGADVRRSSPGQPSPMCIALHMADKVPSIELLRKGALIDCGAAKKLSESHNHDLAREIWEGIDVSCIRPEDRAILLDAALRSGKFSADDLPGSLAHRSQDMLEPFLTAAMHGEYDIVEKLAQSLSNINAVDHQDQRSALHLAASNDHSDIVNFLIEHGANYDLIDSQGRTPLHTSVEKPGHSRCLEFLFPKVDVNSRDKDGLTVWHVAALTGNIHALRVLTGFAANGPPQLDMKANDGRTLLHCAAQSSSKETLIFLMDHFSQSAVHQTTSEGFTALHYAVKADSLDAVQYLIEREVDINAITNDGSNALHCAVDHDSEIVCEIVELLLKRGVNQSEVRKDGLTPINLLLSLASQKTWSVFDSDEIVESLNLLAKNAPSLNITCGLGLNPLHQVCQIGEEGLEERWIPDWRFDALKILLQSGADPTVQDKMGKTALMYLVEAWKRNFETSNYAFRTKTLVDMMKELFSNTNSERYLSKVCLDPQILCIALISQNEQLADEVLKYCPSVDTPVYEISGLSSLETACKYGCSRRLLEELLGRSAVDPCIAGSTSGLLTSACMTRSSKNNTTAIDLLELGFDPNDCIREGKSALMFAAEASNLAVVEILINHGADVSATDRKGWSVINYALLSGNNKLLHFLLRFRTDWNAVIAMGSRECWHRDATALHLAASLHSCALDFLLTKNLVADINHVTNLQTTALCVAVLHGRLENVDLLLEAKADATISDQNKSSPLHYAAHYGNMDIVTLFASRGTNLLLQDSLGFTPELVARKAGHSDIATFLRENTTADNGSRTLPKPTSESF